MAIPQATKRQLDVVNEKIKKVEKESINEEKVQEMINKSVLDLIKKEY